MQRCKTGCEVQQWFSRSRRQQRGAADTFYQSDSIGSFIEAIYGRFRDSKVIESMVALISNKSCFELVFARKRVYITVIRHC
jgi:hypothetical protein